MELLRAHSMMEDSAHGDRMRKAPDFPPPELADVGSYRRSPGRRPDAPLTARNYSEPPHHDDINPPLSVRNYSGGQHGGGYGGPYGG